MKFVATVKKLGKSSDADSEICQKETLITAETKLQEPSQPQRRINDVSVLIQRMNAWISKQKGCVKKLIEHGFEEPAQAFAITVCKYISTATFTLFFIGTSKIKVQSGYCKFF